MTFLKSFFSKLFSFSISLGYLDSTPRTPEDWKRREDDYYV